MLINLKINGLSNTFKNIDLSFVQPKTEPLVIKKNAAIYGANASGKTSLLSSLKKLQEVFSYPSKDVEIELSLKLRNKIFSYHLKTNQNLQVEKESLEIDDLSIAEDSEYARYKYSNVFDRELSVLTSDFAEIKALELSDILSILGDYKARQVAEVSLVFEWIHNIKFCMDLGEDIHLDRIESDACANFDAIDDFCKRMDVKFDWHRLVDRNLSSGERKIYALAEILSDPNIEMLVIDDIESHLHPLVVDGAIDYLKERNIQSIFTTHSPRLISKLDREDVWFVAKGELYSLVEFKFDRPDEFDMEKQYLDGRFDAVPFVR